MNCTSTLPAEFLDAVESYGRGLERNIRSDYLRTLETVGKIGDLYLNWYNEGLVWYRRVMARQEKVLGIGSYSNS